MAKPEKKEAAPEKSTQEAAAEKLELVKAELAEKREELNAFLKEKGLKKGVDYSSYEDEAIAKSFRIKNKKVQVLQAEADELRGKAKTKKAPKDSKPRDVKYAYPEGLDSDGKKKFRVEMRAKAKQAGVEVDEYLKNPNDPKFVKAIAEKEAAKSEKRKAQGQKLAEAQKAKAASKAPAENGTAKPAKEAKVVPLAKKKKVAAPSAEEED